MKVREAIDQLEIGDTVWAKATVNAINFEGGYIRAENTTASIYLDGNAEISLEEPQAEKVEVTEEEVAMIKIGKKSDMSVYGFLNSVLPMAEAYDDRLAKAYLYGYTVKPKRWVVKAPNGKYFISLAYGSGIGNLAECSAKTKDDAYPFTDKSKAEAVATLVEGSVEEID